MTAPTATATTARGALRESEAAAQAAALADTAAADAERLVVDAYAAGHEPTAEQLQHWHDARDLADLARLKVRGIEQRRRALAERSPGAAPIVDDGRPLVTVVGVGKHSPCGRLPDGRDLHVGQSVTLPSDDALVLVQTGAAATLGPIPADWPRGVLRSTYVGDVLADMRRGIVRAEPGVDRDLTVTRSTGPTTYGG